MSIRCTGRATQVRLTLMSRRGIAAWRTLYRQFPQHIAKVPFRPRIRNPQGDNDLARRRRFGLPPLGGERRSLTEIQSERRRDVPPASRGRALAMVLSAPSIRVPCPAGRTR